MMILPLQRFETLRLILLFVLISSINVIVNGQADTTSCYSSINDIESAEVLITDYSTVRLYILCPETTFSIGIQDYYGTLLTDTGSTMIHLRPNLHIQCGTDGSRMNNCIINGGTTQVDGTPYYGSNITSGTILSNVILTGLTFTNVQKHFIWIDQPGNVLIRDCSFQDATNSMLPIFLDYFDTSTAGSVLNVTIQQCIFQYNKYYGTPAQPSLIVGNSKQNHLIVTDTNFTYNDLIFNNTNYDRESFLIESSGPVELTRNCFLHNTLGVAPVGVFGSTLVASNNFQYNSSGGVCQVSAYFTASSYLSFSPICASSDSPRCQAIPPGSNITIVETTAPTATVIDTNTTTAAPTITPTVPLNGTVPTLSPVVATSSSPIITTNNNTAPTTPTPAPSPTLSSTTAPIIAISNNETIGGSNNTTNTTKSPSIELSSSISIMKQSSFYFTLVGIFATAVYMY